MESVVLLSENRKHFTVEMEVLKRFVKMKKISNQKLGSEDGIGLKLAVLDGELHPRQDTAATVDFWHGILELGGSVPASDFHLDASRLARKHNNLDLSQTLLLKHLRVPSLSESEEDAAAVVRSKFLDRMTTDCTGFGLPVARHAAKLLLALEKTEEGFHLLTDAVARTLDEGSPGVMDSVNENLLNGVSRSLAQLSIQRSQGGMREELSRALLRLGEWMAGDSRLGKILLTKESEQCVFIKLLEEQLNMAGTVLSTFLDQTCTCPL